MNKTKQARYIRLIDQLKPLLEKTMDTTARMATLNALLYHKIQYIFWCGFYLLKNNHLIVGPYQGPLACVELPAGKGVCRAAIERGETVLVDDVHAFPGHIACDSRSKSEIVIPLRDKSGKIIGVLDIDSDKPAAFCQTDKEYLEEMARLIITDTE